VHPAEGAAVEAAAQVAAELDGVLGDGLPDDFQS
jgi:hypothetical protein